MNRPTVLHLIDDMTTGGVTRVLQFLVENPSLAEQARHEIRSVRRNRVSRIRLEGDVLVSHLAMNWAGVPDLMRLRSLHAKTPLLHVEHSYTEAFVALNVPHKRRFVTLLRTGYSLFDRIIAVSHTQAEWFSRRRLARSETITVIQSATDLSRFRSLPPPEQPLLKIGAIGRLHRQKGFDLLIEAFRRTTRPDLRLDIFGEGPERQALKELAGSDPRIRFHGLAHDPVAAIASVDIVAMPSRWEAFGMVAAEAQAAGRPVLVNPVDGLRDQTSIGIIAVPEFSVASWSEAIEELAGLTTSPAVARDVQNEVKFVSGWKSVLNSLPCFATSGAPPAINIGSTGLQWPLRK
ncbi:glycosyltransferase family 4 protein [Palleronia caenipelagi]|uniref:Glycosyltransferase family 4 protein n=1 Tax=Palleronia caenipelagi TaxID=2489174 RepID=A0A547PMF8_9RHOB|nr:glycosyltransferase family 4 protein [Palleronia caenipelagi]TRD15328.1 glycosyltransferase family 4 protein [Palleronia caenipelagi]